MLLQGALLWLTLNIYHESRGQPDMQQMAVAHVTINRANESGETIKEVVKKRAQFSWRLDRKKRAEEPWKTDPEVFLKCGLNAVRALHGPDFTNGSTYFHETRVRPKWAKKKKMTGRHGRLIFYKERDKG